MTILEHQRLPRVKSRSISPRCDRTSWFDTPTAMIGISSGTNLGIGWIAADTAGSGRFAFVPTTIRYSWECCFATFLEHRNMLPVRPVRNG
jgi:hypothetical protein